MNANLTEANQRHPTMHLELSLAESSGPPAHLLAAAAVEACRQAAKTGQLVIDGMRQGRRFVSFWLHFICARSTKLATRLRWRSLIGLAAQFEVGALERAAGGLQDFAAGGHVEQRAERAAGAGGRDADTQPEPRVPTLAPRAVCPGRTDAGRMRRLRSDRAGSRPHQPADARGAGAGIAVLPDFLYRPRTRDAEHVECARCATPCPPWTWAWCGGAAVA